MDLEAPVDPVAWWAWWAWRTWTCTAASALAATATAFTFTAATASTAVASTVVACCGRKHLGERLWNDWGGSRPGWRRGQCRWDWWSGGGERRERARIIQHSC